MQTQTVAFTLVSLLAFGAACGRTGLDPRKQDPSSAFGGSSLSSGGGSGAAGTGDTGGTTVIGGIPTHSGGSSFGGSIKASPDAAVGPEATAACNRYAKPSCLPGPPVATRLTVSEEDWRIEALASSGEDLFFASTFSYDISVRGRLTRLSLRSLAMDTYEEKGKQAGLRYQAQAVVCKPSFYNPSYPYDDYSPAIALWDLQTGNRTNLPNPEGFQTATSRSLARNSRGEVFWSPAEGKMAIVKWDPCTGKTEVLLKDRWAVVLLADESNIYWQEPKGGRNAYPSRAVVYAMPIKGGTASLLLELPVKSWLTPVLLAMDDERLYYFDPNSGVLSMTKQGGDTQSVLPREQPLWLDSSTIDGTHIYWVASDDQNTVRRTPKGGGNAQGLWTAAGRPIQAIGADACNVYWAVSNPQEIYFRSK